MTEYICLSCGTKQYTADTKSTSPCINCGSNEVIKNDEGDKKK